MIPNMSFEMFLNRRLLHTLSDVTTDLRRLDITPERTVVVNINTINGYFHHGGMFSPRLEKIIPRLVRVNERYLAAHRLFLCDAHTSASSELTTYPTHCTTERERAVIKELANFSGTILPKNCTNGFLTPGYARWLSKNLQDLDTFLLTGAMSDISVLQFALSQKAYLDNINNRKVRIVAVTNAMQTFSAPEHDGDLMHAFARYNLYINGIQLATI